MLRNREIELIVGLVEGTLEDETEARALLDRSDEARAEFEAQRSVREMLRRVSPTLMSEDESATIRREIWTELSSDAASTRKSTPWIYRLAPVAAVLVLVVGALAVINRGFQGAEETAETFADAAAELSADTTEAATRGGLESAGDDAAAPAAEGDGEGNVAEELSVPEAMPPNAFFAAIAELVRSNGSTSAMQFQRFFADEPMPSDVTDCLASSDLGGYSLFGRATNTEGEGDQAVSIEYLVLIGESIEVGPDTEITFVSIPECEVVHVEE